MNEKLIKDKLVAALKKQVSVLNEPVTNIQLEFSLSQEDELKYKVLAGFKEKRTVSLSDLIGSNFYNALVKSFLKKAVRKAADLISTPVKEVQLIISTANGQTITIIAQRNHTNVKELLITDIYK